MGSQKTLKSYAEWRLQENMMEYSFYVKKFKRLLLTMFDWNNLPDGISERFIEDKLFNQGQVVFYKSTLGFYKVSQATEIGFNEYEEPIGYRTYSINQTYGEHLKSSECIPIWNDYFRQPNIHNVNFFAKRLSNIEKTCDINLEQMKNPYIISCSEGMLASVKDVLSKKTNGEPFILVDEDFHKGVNVNVFNLEIKNHTMELQNLKRDIVNEALTFFGIDNVNVNKRERLITREAEQNDEEIFLNRNTMFKARREAVYNINEKFGCNIEVTLAKDFTKKVEEFVDDISGGADDE